MFKYSDFLNMKDASCSLRDRDACLDSTESRQAAPYLILDVSDVAGDLHEAVQDGGRLRHVASTGLLLQTETFKLVSKIGMQRNLGIRLSSTRPVSAGALSRGSDELLEFYTCPGPYRILTSRSRPDSRASASKGWTRSFTWTR